MDCYCRSHVQQLVSQQAPSSRSALSIAVGRASRRLDIGATRKAIDQFAVRLEKCVTERGGHFEMRL